jgi:hypothetical protein
MLGNAVYGYCPATKQGAFIVLRLIRTKMLMLHLKTVHIIVPLTFSLNYRK